MVEQQQEVAGNEHAQTYFVGTDGSQASHDAFNVVLHGLIRERVDELVVGHVSNAAKEYLPYNMQSDWIKETY